MDDEVAQHLERLRRQEAEAKTRRETEQSRAQELIDDFVKTMQQYRVQPVGVFTSHRERTEGKYRRWGPTDTVRATAA